MDFVKPHNSHKIELMNWEIPAFIQLWQWSTLLNTITTAANVLVLK